MDIFQTIILSLIQGLSEFLPISSSAHLILASKLSDWPDQGLGFDVVVHLGTLSAIIYYYRSLIRNLSIDFFYSVIKTQSVGQSNLAWGVLLGTIPVGLAGILLRDFVELNLRSVEVIAYATIIFGLLLGLASWINSRKDIPREMVNWVDVAFIGAMQALALVPGTSRSGITITAGLLVGLSKKASTQFAFLLSIPVISISSLLIIVEIYNRSEKFVDLPLMILGFFIAALSSYFTIVFFIKLLDKIGMMPFVVYRIILGVMLLAF